MHQKISLFLSMWLLPALALGQGVTAYECSMDGNVRRVVILTEPGVTVPCEVQYHKDTEAPGDVQVLWSASTQADYCETKASEFIARLADWGWSCSAGDTTSVEDRVEPAGSDVPPADDVAPADAADMDDPADDTDALEPAGSD